MNPDSDLPYVRSGSGLERANPVVTVAMGTYMNLSGNTGAANTPKTIFPVGDESEISRILAHVGTSGSIWFTVFADVVPAANAPGCLELLAGDQVEIDTRAEVRAIGTEANINFTAMVR